MCYMSVVKRINLTLNALEHEAVEAICARAANLGLEIGPAAALHALIKAGIAANLPADRPTPTKKPTKQTIVPRHAALRKNNKHISHKPRRALDPEIGEYAEIGE
jgi:predicted ATPase